MAKAFNILSSRNKFAKRHYEAIALAIGRCRWRIRLQALQWLLGLRNVSLTSITRLRAPYGHWMKLIQDNDPRNYSISGLPMMEGNANG